MNTLVQKAELISHRIMSIAQRIDFIEVGRLLKQLTEEVKRLEHENIVLKAKIRDLSP